MTNSPDIAIWISDIEKTRPSFLHIDESRDTVRVYSVPVNMIQDEDISRGIFSPTIVTVGPLHYNQPLRGNAIKKEVVHTMLISPNESSLGRSLLSKLIEKVAAKEDEIKNAYADRNRIPNHLHGSRFAQMVVEDSCFVLFALSLFSIKKTSERHLELASVFIGKEDEVLGDMLKLENQIPLFVLKCVADGIPGWESTSTEISSRIDMAKALQTMCPLVIKDYVSEDFDKKLWRKSYRDQKGHLLSLMVQFMTQELDEEEQIIQQNQKPGHPLSFIVQPLQRKLQRIHCASFTRLGFYMFYSSIVLMITILRLILFLIFLGVFFVILTPFFTVGCIFNCIWGSPRESRQYFTVKGCIVNFIRGSPRESGQDLTVKGFRVFNALIRSESGLRGIGLRHSPIGNFNIMTLPKMRRSKATETILKNIISLERCHPKLSTQRVTNYMYLVAFLIVDTGDVKTLVRTNVISGKQADSEMRWIVDMRTWLGERRCLLDGHDAASVVVTGMRNLREPRAWWKLFKRADAWVGAMKSRYTTSAWVAISTVGAIMLLGMTAVQVACLFTQCNGPAKG